MMNPCDGRRGLRRGALMLAAILALSATRLPAQVVPVDELTTNTAQAPAAAAADTTETADSGSRIKFSGSVTAGGTWNSDRAKSGKNFGRLFDDRTNSVLLNQALFTVERPLDPLAKSFDWGFRVQTMYGSDARYTHTLGLLDNVSNDLNEPDIVEAYFNMHFPFLTEKGLDVKVGQFATLEGAEVIDASANFFYSHSYIFNYGIPLKHFGVLGTFHATDKLDLYAGLTRGVNTSFDDNNDALGFHGGIGYNWLDGKITMLASTHIGPENANDGNNNRYLHDLVLICKLTEKLTATTDLNFAKEDSVNAEAYGIAQYFTYTINDYLSAGVRGEVFRDDDGFFVAQFGDNDDFINMQRGEMSSLDKDTIGGGATTYGALTLGLNIKPFAHSNPLGLFKPANFVLRPEVRYDRALNGGSTPFDDGTDRNMFTAALAATYTF
jgi:hypothetical protein